MIKVMVGGSADIFQLSTQFFELVAISLTYALTRNDFFLPVEIILSLGILAVLQVVNPYKKRCNQYRTLDALFLISLIGFTASLVIHERSVDWYHLCNESCPTIGTLAATAFCVAPLIYFVTLSWKQMKLRCQDKVCCCQKNRRGYEQLSAAQPLINSTSTSSASTVTIE